MKKRVLATIALCVLLISIFSVMSSAANVDLLPSDHEAFSGTTTGYSAFFYGRNKETSHHWVYFESQSSSDGTTWFPDVKRYIGIGSDCPITTTTSWSNACLWRLRLNPTGVYKNCAAYGYIFRNT